MILGLQEKKANSQFIERFLIRCRETKTKVITTANQDKENYDGSQLELELPGAREKVRDQVPIYLSSVSDWLKFWRALYKPIIERGTYGL